MLFCYNIFRNYGIAIILFTLISKLVLLPISIWVQKNSIKMVKMQPDINKINIKYYGDKDKIADEQAELYKKEGYNPLLSLIPLIIQILLLLGVVEVINHPISYIANIKTDKVVELTNVALSIHKDLDQKSSSKELVVFDDIKNNKNIEAYSKIINQKEKQSIKNINMKFLGIDLTWVAINKKGIAWLIPLIAGLSAWLLCVAQNAINVLQAEQSKANKYGMMIFSVGLSLYLGSFVAAGVALYWVFSNLFAIIQQLILNYFINPKKYVDYEELEKTTKELLEMNKSSNVKLTKEQKKKEKEDYKRFFSIINKHLVFYSESNGFYKYYKDVIEYILDNTNITIHYITSDYNDKIFELEKENNQIKAYFITEKKLITLMMKLEADIVVMTMPDLETFHIKRSYYKKDIEYIYLSHGQGSNNLTLRYEATRHYDTIFCTGKHQYDEEVELNKLFKINRKLIKAGYPLLDDMIKEYKKDKKNKINTILIAPSWQKDNIIDLCLDEVLETLKGHNYKVIVRPHPQQVRHAKERFEMLKDKYKNDKTIEIQTDFSNTNTVFESDIVITDWSDIATEFAFTTKKPVIFIDTPMKIMNPEYKKIKIEPFNIWIREEIGKVVKLKNIKTIDKVVDEMLKSNKKYEKKINDIVNEDVYNIGNSAEVEANYIIDSLQEKIKNKEKN